MNKRKNWALITGANGGIGRALVREFSNNGYNVIATDITQQNDRSSDNVVNIQLDLEKFVADENYANNFASKVNGFTQGVGITSLINNAAVQILIPTEKLSRAQWQTSFNVNLSAPFFMVQTFLNQLTGNKGAVVNISSIHATQTKKEFVAYATSKAGLSSLTRNLAIDLGSKIRINAIEPAAVCTEMLLAGFKCKPKEFAQLSHLHPMGRIAEPNEIAELAIFLCSAKANFIQGECINISGGIHSCLHDPD